MTFEKLKELYARITEKDTAAFTMESRLVEDLEMDSVLMLYIAISIEEEFGIAVDNTLLNTVKTVGDMVGYIEARQK